MTYNPLETMITTGGARVDRDGCLTVSGEYVAALYESHASDQEWSEGETYLTRPATTPVATFFRVKGNDYAMAEYSASLASLGSYCAAAEVATEDLWFRDVESTMGW